MISRKTLVILLGVLVVLGVAATLTGKSRYSTAEGGGFVPLLGDSFDPASVETVRAWLGSLPDDVVELERSADGWTVASRWGWKAKDDLVQRLLDDLGSLQGEKRAASADVLSDFQADDEMGLHVVGSGAGGTEQFHLIVGKTSIRGGGFVRRADSDEVYLTQAPLRSSFGVWGDEPKAPDAKRWIELRVNQADRQDVDVVFVQDGGTVMVLEKEFESVEAAPTEPAEGDEPAEPAEPAIDRSKWTWKADSAGEFDKGKVDGILNSLCSLYAFDVADPDSAGAYGLAEPSRSVEMIFEASEPLKIYFGNRTGDDKKMYFKVGEDGKPATVYTSTVDRIFQSREDLKPQA